MRQGTMALAVCALTALGWGPAMTQEPTPLARAEREAVLAVVQAFFDTMAAKDVPGAERVLIPEGRFIRSGSRMARR